ncbi:STON2 protein, partial [Polypterus senegalus]
MEKHCPVLACLARGGMVSRRAEAEQRLLQGTYGEIKALEILRSRPDQRTRGQVKSFEKEHGTTQERLKQRSNSSVFQEDEDVSMEAGSSAQSSKSVNGQMARSTARFASWVTFDDDDDDDLSLHSSPKPSVIKLDNVCLTTVQDANSNLIVSDGSSAKKEVSIDLLDWTPEKNESPSFLDSPFSEAKTPSRKKNPFLDEELSHVQPSPINPFSAYFDQTGPPLVDISQSNGTNSENTQVFAFSSPFFIEEADGKTNSLIQFSPTFDTSSEGMLKYPPRNETLEHLKQLQISVLDEQDVPLPDDSVITDELDEVPFEISYTQPKDGWPMMLRIPERKNIMSSRHWGPISVKLTDSACLQLYYEQGMEKPFKELQLEASHELSEPKLQNYDENGRIHTVRIDHVTYKEKKKYHPKPAVIHAPVKEQLIKLGTLNYEDFQSFRIAVHKKLMHLPRDVDFLTTYSEEEISVEVRDEFCGMVSKNDSRILRHSVLTHISALAFISGTPLCKIGFNDIQVKGNEVVSRHDIIPNSTTRWIKLRDCHFHQCVEEQEFHNTRTIAFNPPRAQWFELMHFRTAFAEKSLPFSLRTVATINGAEVELQSWLVMSTGFSSNRDPLTLIPCENVMIRYPVPASWVKNFRRESVMGEKSLKARMNKGASFGSSSVSGSEPVMRVTLGTAKYEQAFKAVVWRMNRLPDKNSGPATVETLCQRLTFSVPDRFTQRQRQRKPRQRQTEVHTQAAGGRLSPKLYRSVIEDVINDVRELFLDEGVDEQVLLELRTSAAATAATLALPAGVAPYQQLITNQGQILQVVRAPNGTQYILQPQQQVVLQQQVIPQMQAGGVQAPVIQQEPLNSEDDVSDEEGQELFDTENVVVCQYDKIHRSKNKWKFHLKDGIMNLNGRDYVFFKAIGDAEW